MHHPQVLGGDPVHGEIEEVMGCPTPPPITLPEFEPFQIVRPDGQLRAGASLPLEDEELLLLYGEMAMTRAIDRQAIALQRQGQLGVYASSAGQEGIQVGSVHALTPGTDWVFPAYRELGAAIAWNVDPCHILHMWRGTWFSDYDFRQLRYGLQTIPVSTQFLHATGFAMGIKLDSKPDVVLTFIGDGATSEGDCHEALNFAAIYHVPCVFVVQNNQWAISVPYASQTRAPRLAYRGVGYGMPAVVVDGNDVLASYEVTAEAVRRARAGGGPTLIEAITYRLESHTTADDATRYRREDEVAAWRYERDPLVRVERLLRCNGLWCDDWHNELQARIKDETHRVRAEIYDAPVPAPDELFDHVYVEPGHSLLMQREAFRQEMAQGEPSSVGTTPDHDGHRDERLADDQGAARVVELTTDSHQQLHRPDGLDMVERHPVAR